jgi:hypothetical protein
MVLSITTLCHFVDVQYVQYHVLFLVILSDVMQSVIMPSVVMLSIVIPSVLAPTAPVATHWAKMVSNTPDTKARTFISDQPL